jgi:hypothetical protein
MASEEEQQSSDEEQQQKSKDFVPFDDLDAAEAGINILKGSFAWAVRKHTHTHTHSCIRDSISITREIHPCEELGLLAFR